MDRKKGGKFMRGQESGGGQVSITGKQKEKTRGHLALKRAFCFLYVLFVCCFFF
jgi:hypothetical protein